MNVIATKIPGVLIIAPHVVADERGFFFESFNQQRFNKAIGYEINFVQDNHSKSVKNTLRGLHYQLSPRAQGKLVRVILGKVFDVAVDLREDSPTFGHWVAETLSAENKKQLWIPPGLAHGFLTLSETAEFLYKTTDYYVPELERCIRWDDPRISINWPLSELPIVSVKDMAGAKMPCL